MINDIDEARFDNLSRQLANRTNSAVENVWPALTWLAENVETIAGRRVPLIVGGDIVGGNLSAIMPRRARDSSGAAIDLPGPDLPGDRARPGTTRRRLLTGICRTS